MIVRRRAGRTQVQREEVVDGALKETSSSLAASFTTRHLFLTMEEFEINLLLHTCICL